VGLQEAEFAGQQRQRHTRTHQGVVGCEGGGGMGSRGGRGRVLSQRRKKYQVVSLW
jgi:hypothetical protein